MRSVLKHELAKTDSVEVRLRAADTIIFLDFSLPDVFGELSEGRGNDSISGFGSCGIERRAAHSS